MASRPFSAAAWAKISGSRWPETTMPSQRKVMPNSSQATAFIARMPAPPVSSSVPSTSKSTRGFGAALMANAYSMRAGRLERPYPRSAPVVRWPRDDRDSRDVWMPADPAGADHEWRASRDHHGQRAGALAAFLRGPDVAARLLGELGRRGRSGHRLVRCGRQLLGEAGGRALPRGAVLQGSRGAVRSR